MMDLSSQLTVFVVSVDDGSENRQHCMEALARQDCRFRLNSIHNVAPMDRAFQEMIDRCKTPYYIQVDHDMILYRDGVRRIYEAIKGSSSKTAIFCQPLWDVHLGNTIIGCKGYRHEIMKEYPYSGSYSCEMDQLNRMTADGFQTMIKWSGWEKTSDCVGEHGNYYTAQTIFIRYKRLIVKCRMYYWVSWVMRLPEEFRKRYENHPTLLNFWAFAGAMVGLASDLNDCDSECDFRDIHRKTEFERLEAAMYPEGPYELSLYMTSRCNMKCRFCRRNLVEVKENPDVTPGVALQALDKFPTIKSVCLAGFGEPLLNPHLYEIIKVLKERNMYVFLITNGLLLKDHMERLVNSDIDSVSVSINGVTAEKHEGITGAKAFSAMVEGVRALAASTSIEPRISLVCSKGNYRDIPALLSLAHEWGVGKVDLVNILPHGDIELDDEGFWSEVLRSDDLKVVEALKEYQQLPLAKLVQCWPTLIKKGEQPNMCRSPFVAIGVDGSGACGGCRRVYPPDKSHGLITHENAWQSPYYIDLRAQLFGDRPLMTACKMCFGNWQKDRPVSTTLAPGGKK